MHILQLVGGAGWECPGIRVIGGANKVVANSHHIPSQSVGLVQLRFRALHEALVGIGLVDDASTMMAARSPLVPRDLVSRGG